MNHLLELPSYLEQADDVRDRFDRLKQRPVTLEVKDLNKVFETPKGGAVTALKDISFKTHKREFVCVIGPSGCGKSTLIRILAGLETPTSGQVLLDNKEVRDPGPDRGMVFQGYTLFPWLTVKKNVMFGLEQSGHGHASAEQALQWIDLVGLNKFADSYPQPVVRRDEATRCHRACTCKPAAHPADGRTFWRTRCADPLQDAVLPDGNLAEHRHYYPVHHPRP